MKGWTEYFRNLELRLSSAEAKVIIATLEMGLNELRASGSNTASEE